ncbi:hypothetical protein KSP40_PGU006226 [Platanthera guangdongensis]|uniref:Uncharacterized protein n=1 Tax=Platanthera guangdongensis TaxID=2320717 RepID=A0ABR2M4R0_9ASPA
MMKIVPINFHMFHFLLTSKVSPLTPTASWSLLFSSLSLCILSFCSLTIGAPAMVAQPPPSLYILDVVIQPEYSLCENNYESIIVIVVGMLLLRAIICFRVIYRYRTARAQAPPPPKEPDLEARPWEKERVAGR